MKSISLLISIILAILALSLLPYSFLTEAYHMDKILHFSGYMMAGAMSVYLLKKRQNIFIAFFILLIIAVATELLQNYIPLRSGTYGDATANITGLFSGTLISYFMFKNHIL